MSRASPVRVITVLLENSKHGKIWYHNSGLFILFIDTNYIFIVLSWTQISITLYVILIKIRLIIWVHIYFQIRLTNEYILINTGSSFPTLYSNLSFFSSPSPLSTTGIHYIFCLVWKSKEVYEFVQWKSSNSCWHRRLYGRHTITLYVQ